MKEINKMLERNATLLETPKPKKVQTPRKGEKEPRRVFKMSLKDALECVTLFEDYYLTKNKEVVKMMEDKFVLIKENFKV